MDWSMPSSSATQDDMIEDRSYLLVTQDHPVEAAVNEVLRPQYI